MSEFSLQLSLKPNPNSIEYTSPVFLIGSCFTEHISERLQQHKFQVCSNPHGILFNPLSVAECLERYISGTPYVNEDLFYLNELWNSWSHHTRFSHVDASTALSNMNQALEVAYHSIRKAKFLIITLGSSFQYYLKENHTPVANNHRAPSQWFEKKLLDIDTIVNRLELSLENIRRVNPEVQFIFTISPVRHIRDGVVANNRSKARMLEAVHQLCESNKEVHYFPAYELVIDILRDYRFYDIDFVHPNYMATQYVWEQFVHVYMTEKTQGIMEQVKEIHTAKNHRTRFPNTQAHQEFLKTYTLKVQKLKEAYPFLDLQEEFNYFSTELQ